jgi:hypothetical protein
LPGEQAFYTLNGGVSKWNKVTHLVIKTLAKCRVCMRLTFSCGSLQWVHNHHLFNSQKKASSGHVALPSHGGRGHDFRNQHERKILMYFLLLQTL